MAVVIKNLFKTWSPFNFLPWFIYRLMRIESNILILENPFFLIFRDEKLDYSIVFFNKPLIFSLFINDGDRAPITRRRFLFTGDSQNRCELNIECFVAAILNFKQAVNWKREIFENGSTFWENKHRFAQSKGSHLSPDPLNLFTAVNCIRNLYDKTYWCFTLPPTHAQHLHHIFPR